MSSNNNQSGVRLQWLERLRAGNRTSQISNISNASSGPKSPTSPGIPNSQRPEALASLQASLEASTAPAVPMPLHPADTYAGSRPPSFSTRPNTSAAAPAGVTFALGDLEAQVQRQRQRPRRQRRRARWWNDDGGWDGLKGKILALIVSGLLLAISLAVYLGLSLNNEFKPNTYVNGVLILALLVTGIFFCHALVRLCILASKPSSQRNGSVPEDFLDYNAPLPRRPIPVQFPESPTTGQAPKAPPPAYGLWRYSVRVRPEQLQWVRREEAMRDNLVPPALPTPVRPDSRASARPPSYISDNGVDYVVEANPRSTVMLQQGVPQGGASYVYG